MRINHLDFLNCAVFIVNRLIEGRNINAVKLCNFFKELLSAPAIFLFLFVDIDDIIIPCLAFSDIEEIEEISYRLTII